MADALVTHAFVSAKPEGSDPTEIRTSTWNAPLLFSAGADGQVLVRRPASATGAAWEAASGGGGTDASLLTSGTLPDARLSANVPRLDGAQAWSALQTFNGGASIAGVMSTAVDGLVTTSTDGAVVQNTTPATAGVPVQISPRHRLRGTAWATGSGTSRTVDFFTEVLPATGAAAAGTWRLGYAENGGAATYPLTVTSIGGLNPSGSVTIQNGQHLGMSAGGYLTAGGTDGRFLLRNLTLAAGVGLDISTDAVLKIRTRALSGDASLTALNVTASSAIANRTKAGTPVDGDVTTPVDGMCVVDTTASKIWVRVGGTWKGVVVA
jgi:hypothetical protein